MAIVHGTKSFHTKHSMKSNHCTEKHFSVQLICSPKRGSIVVMSFIIREIPLKDACLRRQSRLYYCTSKWL